METKQALDYLEENTPEDLKPIQDAMLTEMTLMGLIGIVTFVLGKFHSLNGPSERVLGDDDAINEILEKVHMLLFFILLVFLLEASFLMFISKRHVAKWKAWNDIALEDKKIHRTLKDHALKIAAGESTDPEMLTFLAIRQRFVFHRQTHETHRAPQDFEFHRYLGQSAGRTIGRLVELDVANWGMLWCLFVLFWGLHWLLKPYRSLYVAIISCIPLIITIFQYIVLLKMRRIREAVAPTHYYDAATKHAGVVKRRQTGESTNTMLSTKRRSSTSILSIENNVTKSNKDDLKYTESNLRPLLDSKVQDDDVLCNDDITVPTPDVLVPEFIHRPLLPCVSNALSPDIRRASEISDHSDLFWFHKSGTDQGPRFLKETIRMMLLCMAVFFSYVVTIFIPNTLFGQNHDDIQETYAYVSVAALSIPSFVFLWLVPNTILTFVVITSVETMKSTFLMSRVKRLMATQKAVKALKMLRSLLHKKNRKRIAEDNDEKLSERDQNTRKASSARWLDENRRFLRSIFDEVDEDKSGQISTDELRLLLAKNRLVDSDHTIQDVVDEIDVDGSGEICFHEFAAWVASGHWESEDIEECVEDLFGMIDANGDGYLSHEEFKMVLTQHAKGLTDADVSALIAECDEDHDGRIDKEEFTSLLKMYSRNF